MSSEHEQLEQAMADNRALWAIVQKDGGSQKHQTQCGQNEQEVARPSTSGINPITVPQPQEKANSYWYKSPAWWGVFVNGILAIFAFGAFCMARHQWEESAKQASAAQRQIDEMVKQRQLDERAWVTQAEVSFFTRWYPYTVTVKYRNSGKTPAVKVCSFITNTYDLAKIPTFDAKPTNGESALLGPNCTEDAGKPIALFPEQAGAIYSGKKLYVYGTIWYTDIFGTNHWSQFSYIVSGVDENEWHWNATQTHNSCDDAQDAKQP